MMDRWRAVPLGLLLGASTFVSLASADVLHLRKGGRLEGIVSGESATSVTMDVGMGHISVSKSSILRIERKDSALAEFRARLSHVAPGDVAAYLDLAHFATNADLRGEARAMWARVASLDPRNVEAHLALGHVLVDGQYVDEAESYRARGFVFFDGRWMTPAEQSSLLREREQRVADERNVEAARRAAREAEERAERAEADAARARAEAAQPSFQPWGYGGVLVGSPYGGGYAPHTRPTRHSGQVVPPVPHRVTTPPPPPPPAPVATPITITSKGLPSSFR